MSIESFINGAVREFAFREYPVSMACACIALDATAKQELGGAVGDRYRAFVGRYLDIITVVGTGGAVHSAPGSTLFLPDPATPGATSRIQDIIYNSVRNYLIHEASFAANVSFTERAFLGTEAGTYQMSTRFIVALLLAVAASPIQAGKQIEEDFKLVLDGRPIPFNSFMGDASAVRAFIGLA